MTGEAEAGSAGAQPAKEQPVEDSSKQWSRRELDDVPSLSESEIGSDRSSDALENSRRVPRVRGANKSSLAQAE